MGTFKSITVVLLILLAIFFGVRLFTNEDSWICVDGSWQQHGNPSSPKPTEVCQNSNQNK